jgi:hypothetical protein
MKQDTEQKISNFFGFSVQFLTPEQKLKYNHEINAGRNYLVKRYHNCVCLKNSELKSIMKYD